MSISHFLYIELFAPYTTENIDNLLQSGLDNDLVYYEYSWENIVGSWKPLNSSEGTKLLLIPDEKEEGGPLLKTKINDTWFDLRIRKSKKGYTILSFAGPCPTWIIEFEDSTYIDFARYIELMLKICKDYTIINIKTDSF